MTEKTNAAVQEFLKSLQAGERQYKDGLAIFPLHSDVKSSYDYLTLDEALRGEVLSVTEIGSGTVPEIKVLNKSTKDVFIMDGEELVGAKQNRIVNISLMVPAESEVNIPVSCVEQGRWHDTSVHFKRSNNIPYANLRKKHKESVIHAMAVDNSYRANQGEVWEDIACCMRARKVSSPTAAMNDIYEKEKNRIEDYRDVFHVVDGQIGAVFAIGKDIFGMDVFDKEETCKKLMPKIINSYVMEILDRKTDKHADPEEVKVFLNALLGSTLSSRKSPGVGVTVSITSQTASGTSLVSKDTVIHTAVFNKPGQEQQEEKHEYMRNPSMRRNYRMNSE